jgi:hypothetical protein
LSAIIHGCCGMAKIFFQKIIKLGGLFTRGLNNKKKGNLVTSFVTGGETGGPVVSLTALFYTAKSIS